MKLKTLHKRKKRILRRKQTSLSIKVKGIELRLENKEFRAFINGREMPRKIEGRRTLVGFEFTYENSIQVKSPEEENYFHRQPNPVLKLTCSVDLPRTAYFSMNGKTVKNEDGTFTHHLE